MNPTIREATALDLDRIVEIMHGEPGSESVAMLGGVDRARKFGRGLLALDHIPNAAKPTVVAQEGDEMVGVLQYTLGVGGVHISAGHVRLAFAVLGPIGVVRLLPRLRARAKVDSPIPADSFHVAEIHVDPARRGEGIGGTLLDWAESEAARRGIDLMTLTTTTTNPARRLYERKGYVVTRTATDPAYERITHIEGRVLMEKRLKP